MFKTSLFNIFRSPFKIPVFEKVIGKRVLDKKNSSFTAKLIPNNYQYKKGTYRTFNYKGINLKADIRDYVGHYLYFGFKDEGQEILMNLAKSGNTILDIGTNIGSTLLMFAQKVGTTGKVFGFEPDVDNYKACMRNVELNDFESINVKNIGLGDEKGEYSLIVDTETNRGRNRISHEEGLSNRSKIKVDTLASWYASSAISSIDLIKIDVEGYEYKVLTGGLDLLKKFKPTLFIELDDNNLRAVGNNAGELVELLQKLNYKVFHSTKGIEILKTDDFENCHYDIIVKPL